MTFRPVDALSEGVTHTLSRNGLLLVLASYLLSAVSVLFLPVRTDPTPGTDVRVLRSPVIGDSVALGALVALVSGILSLYVAIVAFRTFVSGATDRFPAGAVGHRPLWALVNVFVGYLVFGVLVGIGFVLLIVPGFFLLVSLWFFAVSVAVEDESFVEGLERSWALTSENRLPVFFLGVLVVLTTGVLGWLFAIFGAPLGDVPRLLVRQFGASVGTVLGYATTATAFVQLRESNRR
ncbi:hypothetical protein [Halovivax limisalsi]|uniref:hypothetical protein n=1 Tax=Halovivax limisalsi TaxID=1453760 RepID=UPI001FFCAD62|nr:hypothetical protein [Halovivax limisalsi]